MVNTASDETLDVLIAFRDSMRRKHPEAMTPMEVEECRRLMIEDVSAVISIVEDRGKSIRAQENIIRQLGGGIPAPDWIWISLLGMFILGFTLGGIIL